MRTAAAWILPALLGLCARSAASSIQVAGGVVSSREWVVRRKPVREEEFIGEVRYRNAENIFTADWALFEHDSQTWKARGRVRIERRLASGELLEARGEEAIFNQTRETGALWGPAGALLSRAAPGQEPDYARGDRLSWSGRSAASLTGEVRLWGPRLKAWADRADYDREKGTIVLSGGRPVAENFSSWRGAVKAESITAREKEKSLAAEGRAAGWIVFQDSAASGKVP